MLLRTLVDKIGEMMNARFAAIENRLLPEKDNETPVKSCPPGRGTGRSRRGEKGKKGS